MAARPMCIKRLPVLFQDRAPMREIIKPTDSPKYHNIGTGSGLARLDYVCLPAACHMTRRSSSASVKVKVATPGPGADVCIKTR